MDGRISNLSEICYIKRYTLAGGKEEGLKVVEINNGVLRFIVNESKAFDIMQLWHKGENVSFVSKNGFTKDTTVAYNRRFEGGMLYTVGLDSVGERVGFDTHGSFHNIPAKVLSAICTEEKIEVVAEVEDTALFGKNLVMIRKISTALNSDTLTVEDSLVNRGSKDEEYCLLYHINLGYPMLDDGVKVLYDGKIILPRTNLAAERINEAHTFLPPVDNEEERCYFIENEEPRVTVVNEKLNKTFILEYSEKTLPKMVLWQSNASGDYALGLEPTTTFLDDKFKYCVIKTGETKVNKINITVK